MPSLSQIRRRIDAAQYADEAGTVAELTAFASLSPEARAQVVKRTAALVSEIRASDDPGLMEVFLAEYGLSTDEGIALMCLAEALLRVPDAETIDALIEDKIAPSDWGRHLGQSSSSLVNASTWALMLTGRVLDDEEPGVVGILRGAIKRLGEPVIRTAVGRAMREMGRQFVLGEDITSAMKRADGMQAKGFTYSYDMLGEAARTEADAKTFHLSYSRAISAIATHCTSANVADNPGISVKLSALHPRYEIAQKGRVMHELVPRLRSLAILAKSAGMGLNVDAEEADRLSLSLDVIEAVVKEPALKGWDGFGVVVQAYGPRAAHVIDWLNALAEKHDRKFMVRLVKGAYWDAEIKRAQVLGLKGFPVLTRKEATDISYLANARKLLGLTDRLYPQFATHNAHSVEAILHMAREMERTFDQFEFQRLHGMGEALHTIILRREGTHCRIYAPVGAHEDLLAYLVRRLLENGANSSFVNKIVDEDVPASAVAACPFETLGPLPPLADGSEIFAPERCNSKGWDITYQPTLTTIDKGRMPFATYQWTATPLLATPSENGLSRPCFNPANPDDRVGTVTESTSTQVTAAFETGAPWDAPVRERRAILEKAADLYEHHAHEFFALLAREAGKTLLDAVGEVREAVDFLRFYASESEKSNAPARGIWTCISPWNFPLAIFSGQVAAALAAGNGVLAKPAEQTPLVAHRAVALLHEAGVPRSALQLLPGAGDVGATLTSDARVAGVAFTGSTDTALKIRRAMAEHCAPGTPLIAETGGLNAMVVDSTALPEHAVRDIVQSAFQSAGQRCSALRCLYVQDDIADKLLTMLKGAVAELKLGQPWELETDVGPVIDADAMAGIASYIEVARREGRVLFEVPRPETGHFVAPTVIAVDGIETLDREIFGPVLHVARFKAEALEQVANTINATGYGLTFGLHTRIDDRVQFFSETIAAGNLYVNRNQIGAVVGSQPFGGQGLSGTGPKAGGPHYLDRFRNNDSPEKPLPVLEFPGPTGESNRLTLSPKQSVVCLGPTADTIERQMNAVRNAGGCALAAPADFKPDMLRMMSDLAAVMWWGDAAFGRTIESALAGRSGPIVPLITGQPDIGHLYHERHVCIDTTAAGGNAALLAQISGG